MTRILLHGANGAMGKVISALCAEDAGAEIACGVDINTAAQSGYPVYATMEEAAGTAADVIVDFSVAKAVDPVIRFAAEHKVPLVLCTTGLSEAQLEALKEASKETAVLRSANMSLGVNLLEKLAAAAEKVLKDEGFDVEIVEKHHRRKVDAPSGTAIALADAVNAAADGRYVYNYGRHERHEARPADEIGISAVRGGTIVGEHDVIFAGEDEVITISHAAYSRRIFGKGAISAAKFLAGKPAGYYTMADLLK